MTSKCFIDVLKCNVGYMDILFVSSNGNSILFRD